MEKIKFWEDAPGSQSSGRLAFLVKSAWNLVICSVLILKGTDPVMVLAFFTGVEGTIGTIKLIANNQENAANKTNVDNNTGTGSV